MLVLNEEKTLDNLSDTLAEFNISVKTADGTYRNFNDVINDISDIWETLDEDKQGFITWVLMVCKEYTKTTAHEIGKSLKSILNKVKSL